MARKAPPESVQGRQNGVHSRKAKASPAENDFAQRQCISAWNVEYTLVGTVNCADHRVDGIVDGQNVDHRIESGGLKTDGAFKVVVQLGAGSGGEDFRHP